MPLSYAKVVAGSDVPKAPSLPGNSVATSAANAIVSTAGKLSAPILQAQGSNAGPSFLSPLSKALIDKPQDITPQLSTGKKRKLSAFMEDEGISPKRLQMSFRNESSLGGLQQRFSSESNKAGLTFAKGVNALYNGTSVETYALRALLGPTQEAQADLAQFRKAAGDLLQRNADDLSSVKNFLTGNDFVPTTRDKNFLITIVDFEGLGQLRFISMSGSKVRPPVATSTDAKNEAPMGKLSVVGDGQPSNYTFNLIPPAPRGVHQAALTQYAKQLNLTDNKIYYLGYHDLLVKSRDRAHALRLVPKVSTHKADGLVHDRANDTEYFVLNGLRTILDQRPELSAVPINIRMFSKLRMCEGCELAANYAAIQKQFSNLQSLRVYGG
ncbi:MAG TPA: hypothetical protein VGE55_01345 [Limnobacter sp.]|uniref:hypothetical protein n=1 Tax=Limnobacter sp. TaxID=2003368 RepID=UPI002ED7CED4